MQIRRLIIFTGNRAEYGLMVPVLRSLASSPKLEYSLLVSGSHLKDEFGSTVSQIDMKFAGSVTTITAGSDQADMAEQTGVLLNRFAAFLKTAEADAVVLLGDRFEAFAMAAAAYYSRVPIFHYFGGDLSQGGHLDDSVRHSITKLSNLHFVTNEESYRRVLKLGEEPWRVHNVGSTAVDNIKSDGPTSANEIMDKYDISPDLPLLLFTLHPISGDPVQAGPDMDICLDALREAGHPVLITYPCEDDGAAAMLDVLRCYEDTQNFRIVKSLGWKDYLGVMMICSAVVGNSSSGIMESPIVKVPCINIGDRQAGRLQSSNVLNVPCSKAEILNAIDKALHDHDFLRQVNNCANPYGDGHAGESSVSIIEKLIDHPDLLRKRMTY